MKRRAFTSDMLRDVYNEAVRQGWTPEEGRASGHLYLYCPHAKCAYRKVFSVTCNGSGNKSHNTISDMRRHGFMWLGRGGTHSAALLGSEGET